MNTIRIVKDFFEETFNRKRQDKEIFTHFSTNLSFKSFFGERIGDQSVQLACCDWLTTFPDCRVVAKRIEQYKDTIITQYHYTGTHLAKYPNTKLTESTSFPNISPLLLQLEKVKPTQKKIDVIMETILIFQQNKIIFVSIQEPIQSLLFKQLRFFLRKEEYPNQSLAIDNESFLIENIRKITKKPLTNREIQCLSLHIFGFSSKQIGKIFSISFRTVESHLCKALHTIDCFSKLQCLEKMQESDSLPIWHDLAKTLLQKKIAKRLSFRL